MREERDISGRGDNICKKQGPVNTSALEYRDETECGNRKAQRGQTRPWRPVSREELGSSGR